MKFRACSAAGALLVLTQLGAITASPAPPLAAGTSAGSFDEPARSATRAIQRRGNSDSSVQGGGRGAVGYGGSATSSGGSSSGSTGRAGSRGGARRGRSGSPPTGGRGGGGSGGGGSGKSSPSRPASSTKAGIYVGKRVQVGRNGRGGRTGGRYGGSSSSDTEAGGATSRPPPKLTAEERERIRATNHGKAMVQTEREMTAENKKHNGRMIGLAAAGLLIGGIGLTSIRVYDTVEQSRHDHKMDEIADSQ